jgi:hypothetical protein
MKGQEDFFEKLGMAPDTEEVTDNTNLAGSAIPESEMAEPIENATPFLPRYHETMDQINDRKKRKADEDFEKMVNSRPDIYG